MNKKKWLTLFALICVFALMIGAPASNVLAVEEEVIYHEDLQISDELLLWEVYLSEDIERLRNHPYPESLTPAFTFPAEYPIVDEHTYLYNRDTGEVRDLFDQPLDSMVGCGSYWYGVLGGTTLVALSLEDFSYREIYTSTDGEMKNLSARAVQANAAAPDWLYFSCGSTVYKLQLATGEVECYQLPCEVDFLYPISNHRFAWSGSDVPGDYCVYVRNIVTGVQEEIFFNELFPGNGLTTTAAQTAPATNSVPPAALSIVPQATPAAGQSLPLSEYPVGSYFSNSGLPCDHHPDPAGAACYLDGHCGCKSFANSIQCMGFARYVYATYAHMSSWSVNSSHLRTPAQWSSSAHVKTFLQSLPRGSYLRLETGKGYQHSLVLMSTSSTSVTVYEANYGLKCDVGTRTISYVNFLSTYPAVVHAYAHSFSTSASQYSSAYHKLSCTCGGYLLQQHYAQTPGSNVKCLACGYVGNISVGVNEVPDETESA